MSASTRVTAVASKGVRSRSAVDVRRAWRTVQGGVRRVAYGLALLTSIGILWAYARVGAMPITNLVTPDGRFGTRAAAVADPTEAHANARNTSDVTADPVRNG